MIWSEVGEKILWALSDGLKGTGLISVWLQGGDGHLIQGNEGSLSVLQFMLWKQAMWT